MKSEIEKSNAHVVGDLPARRPDETDAEHEELVRWAMIAAEYGSEYADRHIRRTRPDLGDLPDRMDWHGRYQAWLRGRAAEMMEQHQGRLESLRARFLLAAPAAAEVIIQIAQGINPVDPQTGTPEVRASSRITAAEKILEFAGLAVPRRVELTADDAAVAVARAQQTIALIEGEKLRMLVELLDIRPPVIDVEVAETTKKRKKAKKIKRIGGKNGKSTVPKKRASHDGAGSGAGSDG